VGTVGDGDVLAGMVTANVGYALPLPVPARDSDFFYATIQYTF
jgi:hypothetical protein